MAAETPNDDRIALPADFADHLAAVGNLDTTPETMADYWSQFADQLAASDHTIAPGDLYTDEPTRHEVHVDDRIEYSPCVLDALTAAVLEAQGSVKVRSVDPVTRTPIRFTVDEDSLAVTPDSAVVTFGIAPSIPALEGSDDSIFGWMLGAETADVRTAFCQYINAFESEETYEQWAETSDGETIPLQPAYAVALIRRYVDTT